MALVRVPCRRFEQRTFIDAANTPHVINWIISREECNCLLYQGLRLDKQEQTMMVHPCPRHLEAARRALDRFFALPPSPADAAMLFEQLLVEEEVRGNPPA